MVVVYGNGCSGPLDLGIAIRTGHHCAHPLVESLGVQSVARASFGLYNTLKEVDALFNGIERVMKMF